MPPDSKSPEEINVEGEAGKTILLPIGAGPATGYAWRLELPASVIQVTDAPGRAPNPAERLGGSSGAQLQVTAPTGDHEIIARLARAWELNQPIRVVRIRLHVR